MVGRSQISELVFASAQSCWLRLTTRMASHLAFATFNDFVMDPHMQILFAQIVAYDIATVRFLHATRSQLDRNYARAKLEQTALIQDLERWTFDPNTKTFNPNGRRISINSFHPRGAPLSVPTRSLFIPDFY